MKNAITISMLFLFSFNLFAQNDSIPGLDVYYKHYDSFNNYWASVNFKIGGGAFIPQGDLKNYFGNSPMFELSLDFPVTDKKSIELALQFIVPSQRESFQYLRTIDTIQAKASFMFNPMLRFKKNLSNSKTSQFVLGIGVGASVINTDARNPFYAGQDDKEKYEVVTAFMVVPSLDYVKTFRGKEQLTFSLGVQYSPYKIEGALREKIGSIALTPRLLYSF